MTDPNAGMNPAAAPKPKARKPSAKAKPPAFADVEKIMWAIEAIDQEAADHLDRCVQRLTELHKLKMRKGKDLRVSADMHGITGSPAVTDRIALQNWANAARRALLRAEG